MPEIIRARKITSRTQVLLILDEDLKSLPTSDNIKFFYEIQNNIKTLESTKWSSAISCASEYCRIVWDLFYGLDQASINFAVATHNRRKFYLSQENKENQSYEEANTLNNLREFFNNYNKVRGQNKTFDAANLINKLVENRIKTMMLSASKSGKDAVTESLLSCFKYPVRIILVTSTTSNNIRNFEALVNNAINNYRKQLIQGLENQVPKNADFQKIAEESNFFISIVNLQNNNSSGNPANKLSCEVVNLPGPEYNDELENYYRATDFSLANKTNLSSEHLEILQVSKNYINDLTKLFINLAKKHYNLVVSTVSDIPMKEADKDNDNNSQSKDSTRYEVGLLHQRPKYWPEEERDELQLKWLFPKLENLEMYSCIDSVKICPRNVSARQSSCLTNFIIKDKRSVLLGIKANETSAKNDGGQKPTHLLTTRGGDIYLHLLISGGRTLDRETGHNPLIKKIESSSSRTGRINSNLYDIIKVPHISDLPGGKKPFSSSLSPGFDYRFKDLKDLYKQMELCPLKTEGKNSDNKNKFEKSSLIKKLTAVYPLTHSGEVKESPSLVKKVIETGEQPISYMPFVLPHLFATNAIFEKLPEMQGFSKFLTIPSHYIIEKSEIQAVVGLFKSIIEGDLSSYTITLRKSLLTPSNSQNYQNQGPLINAKIDQNLKLNLITEMYLYINKIDAIRRMDEWGSNFTNQLLKWEPHQELQNRIDELLNNQNLYDRVIEKAKEILQKLNEDFTKLIERRKKSEEILRKEREGELNNQSKEFMDTGGDAELTIHEAPASPTQQQQKTSVAAINVNQGPAVFHSQNSFSNTVFSPESSKKPKRENDTNNNNITIQNVDPFKEIQSRFKAGKKFTKKPKVMEHTLYQLYVMSNEQEKKKNYNREFFARMTESGKPIDSKKLHHHKFELYQHLNLKDQNQGRTNSDRNDKDNENKEGNGRKRDNNFSSGTGVRLAHDRLKSGNNENNNRKRASPSQRMFENNNNYNNKKIKR